LTDTTQGGGTTHHRLAALPPTRWSVVGRAGHDDTTVRVAALNAIVQIYRPVLVQFLVSRLRMSGERAEDFTHTFLVEKLLAQNVLRQAAADKGRFRSFILKVFTNYVKSRLREEQAAKRRHDHPDAVRLDDLPELLADTPLLHEVFDVLWARQLLARAIDRVQEECRVKRREDLWLVLQDRVLGPAIDDVPPMPYDEFVKRFGLKSPSEASNLLITAKRMFIRILRETVRETVADEREVEAEIRELKRILQS
jgi:hypothetical protein